MKSILIVDDDENVLEILKMYLEKESYNVLMADNGKMALSIIKEEDPDLVILDIMMPEMDGKEVIKNLRIENQVPVIFLSARSEELDRVLGFELGADDYVTKPFSPREVVVRVKAVLKRTNTTNNKDSNKKNVIKYPGLVIDSKERAVKVDGEKIKLTPKEYEILLLLARHPKQVFERERLYERVWGMDSYGDFRSVDVHINWLRDKLNNDYIKTVWGIGYKFEVGKDV